VVSSMTPSAEKNQDPCFIAANVAAVVVILEAAVERKKKAMDRSDFMIYLFCIQNARTFC